MGRFQEIGITGPRLLNLDVRDLKALGLAPDDKSKLKRKVSIIAVIFNYYYFFFFAAVSLLQVGF